MKCLVLTGDEPETTESLISLLEEQGLCVTCVSRPREGLYRLGRCEWHLLVVQADGDVQGPLHLLTECRQACCDIPVLALVPQGAVSTAVTMLKAGASDCIETPIERDRLLRVTASLCPQNGSSVVDPHRLLTKTERIVLRQILAGRTTPQIAERLCRSPRTIEVHRRRIMGKLHVRKLTDLVTWAIRSDRFDQNGGDGGVCDSL